SARHPGDFVHACLHRPDAGARWGRTSRISASKRAYAPTMTDHDPPPPSGPEVIRAFVRTLPAAPGVYRMLDAEGAVIYVGKARSLKSRVTNYTRPEALPVRIQRMVAATVGMEFVRTETESEALLLEANMIKRLRPRFNVLLRDD